MEDTQGYDAIFVDEVSDHLKCVVCTFILRNPVQIMTCGHRFCENCFDRIKSYAEQLNTELCCPVDRDVVNSSTVFPDKGARRMVGDLEVECTNVELGCLWLGKLRDIQDHELECNFKVEVNCSADSLAKKSNQDGLAEMVNGLLKRMHCCETTISEKEKDLAHVKFSLHDLKEHLKEKDDEIKLITTMNVDIVNKLESKDQLQQKECKQFKGEIQNIKNENQLLKERLVSVEKEQGLETAKLNACQQGIENLKIKVCESSKASTKDGMDMLRTEVKKSQTEIRSARSHFDKSMNKKTSELKDLNLKLEAVEGIVNDLKDVSSNVKNIESMNKITDEMNELNVKLELKLDACQEEIKILKRKVCEPAKSSVIIDLLKIEVQKCQTEIRDMRSQKSMNKKTFELQELNTKLEPVEKNEIDVKEVQYHIKNIENILYCWEPRLSNEITVKWVLTEYEKHFNIGEEVFSPVFYTPISGYFFQLYVQWSGVKKENLGLHFRLCRGRNAVKDLEPFRIPYTLSIMNKSGGAHDGEVTLKLLDKNKDNCFTIPSGCSIALRCFGFREFLTMPSLKEYVMNDMMYISCTFKLV